VQAYRAAGEPTIIAVAVEGRSEVTNKKGDIPGKWQPRTPERLEEEELADWHAGRDALYQLAALTIGAPLAVADA
jgi:hypothetical protein